MVKRHSNMRFALAAAYRYFALQTPGIPGGGWTQPVTHPTISQPLISHLSALSTQLSALSTDLSPRSHPFAANRQFPRSANIKPQSLDRPEEHPFAFGIMQFDGDVLHSADPRIKVFSEHHLLGLLDIHLQNGNPFAPGLAQERADVDRRHLRLFALARLAHLYRPFAAIAVIVLGKHQSARMGPHARLYQLCARAPCRQVPAQHLEIFRVRFDRDDIRSGEPAQEISRAVSDIRAAIDDQINLPGIIEHRIFA